VYLRLRDVRILSVLTAALLLTACNSNNGGGTGGSLLVTLSTSTVLAPQDGTPGALTVAVSGPGVSTSTTLTPSGLPAGVSAQVSAANPSGNSSVSFNVTLSASPTCPAGTYTTPGVTANTGSSSSLESFTLVVAVATVVSSSTDNTLGINGQLKQFMSTSFQPAEWDYQFFQNHAATEPTQLNFLAPQHIRIQGISEAVPWKANNNPQLATDWDFTMLDAIVQPVLSVTDNSPEFQIAVAPPFTGLVDSSGHLIVNSANLNTMSAYFANLVRYYNKSGFMWGGKLFQSASPHHITWWGIFNEYNINGLTPSEYVQLYNAVVPAMLAVDPTIKISAIELSDYDYTVGDPRNNLPTFVATAGNGGVNAQVNVASTHFYSTCNQTDDDTKIFSSIPTFVADVHYFRQQFDGSANPNLSSVAVWVTENNVNADYATSNGDSACNPGQKYVTDMRAVSQFFAAWRPYVFSQLGKAGSQALYHWDYDADAEFAEVDYNSGNKYLSYWVDYTLGQMFPVTASSAPDILSLTSTETATVEALATKNPDGSYVVMITDRAVQSASDNNGPGSPRTVIVDLSALGNYSSVSQTTLDANTSVPGGPSVTSLTPAPKLSVTIGGYGTTFLHIQP